MDPSPVWCTKVSTDGTERQPVSPYVGLGPDDQLRPFSHPAADSLLVDTLDESRKDVSLGIRSTGSEQNVVWVPVD